MDEGIICKECGSTPCNPNCEKEAVSNSALSDGLDAFADYLEDIAKRVEKDAKEFGKEERYLPAHTFRLKAENIRFCIMKIRDFRIKEGN